MSAKSAVTSTSWQVIDKAVGATKLWLEYKIVRPERGPNLTTSNGASLLVAVKSSSPRARLACSAALRRRISAASPADSKIAPDTPL
jgi:hypothetical protein